MVDQIKGSLNRLANILDHQNIEYTDIKIKRISPHETPSNQRKGELVNVKDVLRENYKLRREINFLKQQLIEKENKIRKMEFLFGHVKFFKRHVILLSK